jgi:hypothetical protein
VPGLSSSPDDALTNTPHSSRDAADAGPPSQGDGWGGGLSHRKTSPEFSE